MCTVGSPSETHALLRLLLHACLLCTFAHRMPSSQERLILGMFVELDEQSGWHILLVIILVNKKPPKGPSATSLEKASPVPPGSCDFFPRGPSLLLYTSVRTRHQTHHYSLQYEDSSKSMYPTFRDVKNAGKKPCILELRNVMFFCLPLSLQPSSGVRCKLVS